MCIVVVLDEPLLVFALCLAFVHWTLHSASLIAFLRFLEPLLRRFLLPLLISRARDDEALALQQGVLKEIQFFSGSHLGKVVIVASLNGYKVLFVHLNGKTCVLCFIQLLAQVVILNLAVKVVLLTPH